MIKIPDWLAKLPKNAAIDKYEFAKAIDAKPHDIDNWLKRDSMDMPKPDKSAAPKLTQRGRKVCSKNYWRAVTVRNYIRHMNRLELEKTSETKNPTTSKGNKRPRHQNGKG